MIQFTKLSKALKNKEYVAWIKKNNSDYILHGHFIFKTNKGIKGAALTKLISILGNVPQEDHGIKSRGGHVAEMDESEMKNMMDLLICKDKKSIHFTNLIHQTDKDLYSIFKGEEDYIFVNKVYIDLINQYEEDIEIYGTTKFSPVYFEKNNEEMMVLPIRMDKLPIHLKGDSK